MDQAVEKSAASRQPRVVAAVARRVKRTMTHDDLEQRLWELEYGLLPAEEAAALREEIALDPEAIQLHTRVRARSSMVAEAARIEGPRQPLRADVVAPSPSAVVFPIIPGSSSSPVSARIKRQANWTLGLASSLLVALLGWMGWQNASPDSELVTNSSRGPARDESLAPASPAAKSSPQRPTMITFYAPARLSEETTNMFPISTKSPTGAPESVRLDVRGESETGESKFSKRVTTDRFGLATLEVPGSDVVAVRKLHLALADGDRGGLEVDINAAKPEYATRLQTDKPRYRPGETVRFRSVTLSRFGLRADREVTVEYSMTDPNSQDLVAAKLSKKTDRGVGSGEYSLPIDAAAGRYTLFARSSDKVFPEVKQDFDVRKPLPRLFDIDVKWDAERYAPRARAQGEVTVRSPDGRPASDLKLSLRGFVDGRPLDLPVRDLTTNEDGKGTAVVILPAQISSDSGEFGMEAEGQETVWRDIPLVPNQVQVDFYPEGGDLVAGVENRVYFHAHDLDGRPVAMRGRVLANDGRQVAVAATQYEGRGAFRYTPQEGVTQTLAVDDPSNIQTQLTLPAVPPKSRLVLDAGAGVFDGPGPLRLRLRSQHPPGEFVVVAHCRGVTVGQQAGSASSFVNGESDLMIPVTEEAAGVLRVTVFDDSQQSTEPLAERLVYRRPQKKLQVQLSGLSASYSVGSKVKGEILTWNETDQPVSALLGVSAVDEAVLQLADQPPPRLPTQFLLLGEVTRTEKLEDVNFLLSDKPAAPIALDLLLGTQGWRRFDRIPASRMAGMGRELSEGLAYEEREVAGKEVAAPLAGDIASAAITSGIRLNRLSEAVDDAPRRFDNRAALADIEGIAGVNVAASASKEAIARPEPARPAVGPPSPPRWQAWIAGLLGAIVILSVALRWRPRASTALGMAVLLMVMGMIGFTWHFLMGSKVSSGVIVTRGRASTTAAMSVSEPAPLDAAAMSDSAKPAAEELRSIVPSAKDAEMINSYAATPASPPLPAPMSAPIETPREGLPQSSTEPQLAPMKAFGGMVPPAAPAKIPALREKPVADSEPNVRRAAIDPARGTPTPAVPADALLRQSARGSTSDSRARTMTREMIPPGAPAQAGAAGETKALAASKGTVFKRQYAHRRETVPTDRTSKDFTESVYWNPWFLTDEQGRATFEFNLPDTATKFRITADGHHEGRLGGVEQSVTSEPKK